MRGYDIRLSDEPGDIVHVDVDGDLDDDEIRALREYFLLVRKKRKRGRLR